MALHATVYILLLENISSILILDTIEDWFESKLEWKTPIVKISIEILSIGDGERICIQIESPLKNIHDHWKANHEIRSIDDEDKR